MTVLQAIFLGILQGVTSMLPVSGSGHMVLANAVLGSGEPLSMTFVAGIHMGTLAAVLLVWRRDVSRMFTAAADMLWDLLENLKIWVVQRRHPESLRYRRLIHGRYRLRVSFVVTAAACTFVTGFLLHRPAEAAAGSLLYTAMGFFVTALILTVSSYTSPAHKKRLFSAKDAMVTGILQGIAVIPGISRMGMVMSASDILGLPSGFGVYIGCLLCVPSVFGGIIIEILSGSGSVPAPGPGVMLAGILASTVTSAWMMKHTVRFLARCGRRGFALYALAAGVVSLLVYM